MRIWPLIAMLMVIAAAQSAALAVTPLKVTSASTLASLPTSAWPYYVAGHSAQPIDSVLARAKQQHKLAFIVLRADGCRECHTLTAFLALPEVRHFVNAHYIVARVDVGHLDKNLQIPARWGIVDRLPGLPTVIIVDPGDGSLVNRGAIADLVRIGHMTPQQIADWLTWWAK